MSNVTLHVPTDLTLEDLARKRVGDFIRVNWDDGRRLTLVVYAIEGGRPVMRPVTAREQAHVWWLSIKNRWRRWQS